MRFYPFKPDSLSRVTVAADLPASDSVVTASSCDARESSAVKTGVIMSLLTGIGGFVLGQHLVVSKKAR